MSFSGLVLFFSLLLSSCAEAVRRASKMSYYLLTPL